MRKHALCRISRAARCRPADEHRRPSGRWWGVACRVAHLGLFLLAACGSDAGHPADNVLLVTLDTTRADRLGCYGSKSGATPSLDRLAARGVLFEQATTPAPMTLPAHASLMTGTDPPVHGVRDNGIFALRPEQTTLAEIMAARGYETAAFVAARVLDPRYGLAQGFDSYRHVPLRAAADGRRPVELSAREVTDSVLAWLAQRDTRPFFAWVHYFDAHAPYRPPEPFAGRFAEDPYLGEIAAVDRQLGRLLAELERRGLTDHTLIIVTADHGEGRGDHGEQTHGVLTYQSTLHVPLIFSHPDLPAGKRSAGPAGLIDVAPTLLGWLGGERARQMNGIDLLDPVRGKARPGGLEDRDIYFETEFPYHNFGWSPLYGLRSGDLEFVLAPSPELYDLGTDPGEQTNLAAQRPDTVREMLGRLLALRGKDATVRRAEIARIALPEAEREALAQLGYVFAGAPSGGRHPLVDPKDRIEHAERVLSLWGKFQGGHWQEAARDARRILQENPDNILAWETLGGIAMEKAKRQADAVRARPLFEEAIRCFDEVLARAPGRLTSLTEKGLALRALGRLGEARDLFSRVMALQPMNPLPYRWLGLIEEAHGESEAAIEHYERFLELWREESPVLEDTKRRLGALRGR